MEINFNSYSTFKTFVNSVKDRKDTEIFVFDQDTYYLCYVVVGDNTGFRNVAKTNPRNVEQIELEDTDALWIDVPVLSRYTEQIWDVITSNIPNRGAALELDGNNHTPAERMTLNNDIIYTITSDSTTEVLHIFKSASDNLHDIQLVLQGEGTVVDYDNFDSYINTAGLRAIWVPNDTINTPNSLITTGGQSGANFMRITTGATPSFNDTITKSMSPAENWSTYQSISFYARSNITGTTFTFRISDDAGVTWANTSFIVTQANTWQFFDLNISSFTNISDIDTSSINRVQFLMPASGLTAQNLDIDTISSETSIGNVSISLYNFDSTSEPTNLTQGSIMVLDDDNTSITVPLLAYKSLIGFHTHYGSHDNTRSLTEGNYYGIYIRKPSIGKCFIYGKKSSDTNRVYQFGGSFSNLISSGDLTELKDGLNPYSCAFISLIVASAYLLKINFFFDADPKNTTLNIQQLDSNGLLKKQIGLLNTANRTTIELDLYHKESLIHMDRLNPIYSYMNDDLTSLATKVRTEMHWAYKPVLEWKDR